MQGTIVALIALFLSLNLWKSWGKLSHYHWHVISWLLVLAGAGYIAQELTYPFVWQVILVRLHVPLPWRKSVRIYLGSEVVRYIPGNVWHVLTRVLWAERAGVPRALGFTSMVLELATKIAAAAIVFAATLLFWRNTGVVGQGWVFLVGTIVLPLLLLALHPRLLGTGLNLGLRLLRRQPLHLPLCYGDVLVVIGCWAANWCIGGAAFYALAAAVTPLPLAALPMCIGIYAIAWDVGFLSFITPSGLGFREGVVILLLPLAGLTSPGATGVAVATVIAFLSRIFATLAEAVCVLGAQGLGRGTAGQIPATAGRSWP
jgi:uncharacterized membrane protein YbhN (UPF0104 family)